MIQELISLLNKLEGSLVATKLKQDLLPKVTNYSAVFLSYFFLFSSVRSSNSHNDLLLIHHHPTPTFSDHTGPQYWTFTF